MYVYTFTHDISHKSLDVQDVGLTQPLEKTAETIVTRSMFWNQNLCLSTINFYWYERRKKQQNTITGKVCDFCKTGYILPEYGKFPFEIA